LYHILLMPICCFAMPKEQAHAGTFLSPTYEMREDIQDKDAACAHPWDAADQVRLERHNVAVERLPHASRSPGRFKGAVLIRLETDVGGLPESLTSWRVCVRGGSRKKKARVRVHPPLAYGRANA
jgi:hypothetical protein